MKSVEQKPLSKEQSHPPQADNSEPTPVVTLNSFGIKNPQTNCVYILKNRSGSTPIIFQNTPDSVTYFHLIRGHMHSDKGRPSPSPHNLIARESLPVGVDQATLPPILITHPRNPYMLCSIKAITVDLNHRNSNLKVSIGTGYLNGNLYTRNYGVQNECQKALGRTPQVVCDTYPIFDSTQLKRPSIEFLQKIYQRYLESCDVCGLIKCSSLVSMNYLKTLNRSQYILSRTGLFYYDVRLDALITVSTD